jgi:hypothetical protein
MTEPRPANRRNSEPTTPRRATTISSGERDSSLGNGADAIVVSGADTTLRNQANNGYSALDQAGDIG